MQKINEKDFYNYDVVVIGAGHAGCEAALSSSRLGARTLLLTINLDSIAALPCNSAIGGPGRGQLVREIDALGGEIGKNTDRSFIHSRIINTSRGPALRTIRAIVDKKRYFLNMRFILENQKNLDLRQGLVKEIKTGNNFFIITLTDGIRYKSKASVISTGTFLRAKIFWGENEISAGRQGEISANSIAYSMEKAGLKFGKFRTETPPRIDRKTMDFSRLKIQNYDAAPHMFSFDGEFDGRQQLNNYITYVEKDCIDYILANKNKSPVLLKKLGSFNPRYCPSIEDKVYRFELKQRHIIFIQPEGIKSNEMYLHGLFTTFSEDIQEGIIKKIIGLEKAQITRPGYGVEYDYLLPHQLRNSLECKQYNGLFFAGQITGTTGYEEAASQGILAGINAALYVKNEEPLIFKRKDGYLGILIDDIVNKGVNEPYRMLTSRNEFRLLHRHDNADIRMLPFIKKLKFYDRAEIIEKKYDKIYLALSEIRKSRYYKNKELLEQIRQDKLSDCDRNSIIGTFSLNSAEYESLIINIKYEIYFKREAQRIEDLEKDSGILIPKNIDFKSVKNLSIEAIEVLKKHQPETVGIAGNLPGIKPLDILSLIAHLKMFHVKH